MELYPSKTRFVVLPMDMKNIHAGKVMEDIGQQHEELATLYENYSDIVIPFVHVDPRREDALDTLQSLVEDRDFKGVKIYPPHGYRPTHPTLMNDIYPYMVEKNIPLMTHCMPGPGIITSRGISSEKAKAYTDPDNYKAVLEKYPELKICLGHFGGIDAWKKYNENPNEPTWLTKICNLMKSYPNLYADISYTISNFEESIKVLTALLNNKRIADRIIFGSDFFMIKPTVHSEEDLYKKLQYSLGEDKFWKIANSNPKRYLQHKPVIKPAAKPVAEPIP
ncbi:amidohydrolase [Photobacterium sagamiensis]|uniref:amidohydrolase family protein n=1 Tax=Photobacterium sagamiensis TaxID=2910241 RepID=UPI003D0E3558